MPSRVLYTHHTHNVPSCASTQHTSFVTVSSFFSLFYSFLPERYRVFTLLFRFLFLFATSLHHIFFFSSTCVCGSLVSKRLRLDHLTQIFFFFFFLWSPYSTDALSLSSSPSFFIIFVSFQAARVPLLPFLLLPRLLPARVCVQWWPSCSCKSLRLHL